MRVRCILRVSRNHPHLTRDTRSAECSTRSALISRETMVSPGHFCLSIISRRAMLHYAPSLRPGRFLRAELNRRERPIKRERIVFYWTPKCFCLSMASRGRSCFPFFFFFFHCTLNPVAFPLVPRIINPRSFPRTHYARGNLHD